MLKRWPCPPVSWEGVLIWAACCMGFFGFLHSGELTCPSSSAYKENTVSWSCVYGLGLRNVSIVTAHLRRSKTDTFGVGAMVCLGRVDGPICPVSALLGY